nr:hypothetical protein [Tanacetum cinerariifolium]
MNVDAQSQAKDTVIQKLREKLQSLCGDVKERKVKREIEEIETLNIELDHRVTKLVAENEHLKQTYKQLYDSIKSSRVRSKEQCDELIKQVNLKSAEISELNATPKLRKNRTAHTDYIRYTLEEAATLREIVESERLINPLNTSLDYACKYTKHIQELLIILQQTCPCITNLGTKLVAVTPKNKNKQIRLAEHIPKSGKTTVKTTPSTKVVSNTHVLSFTGVNLLSSACGSQSQDNTKNDRIQRTPRKPKKNNLEEHFRTFRPSLNKKSVVDTKATSSVTNSMSNVNSDLRYTSCNGCLFFDNHDACVVTYINSVNARWTFTLVGNVCPLTRIATTAIVPLREPILIESNTDKPVVTLVYSRKSKAAKKKVPVSKLKANKSLVVQIILWYLDSCCSKHITGDRSQLINFVQKFLGTVKFQNDHVAKIMGYGDYQIENVTISRVYYVEGLGHNLFSVGQFCDSDLEASKTKSWLWHRRLSHPNFGAINHLARQGLVRDINIDALYNILKQNQGDVNDVMGSKKKTIVVTSDPLALIAE